MAQKIPETIVQARDRSGYLVRMQKRGEAYDVIYNTGYCWKYLAKAVTEPSARFTFDLRVL